MDQLLAACHAQTLNLFVESFLKMVQKLLESTDPQLQILATQSVSFYFLSKLKTICSNSSILRNNSSALNELTFVNAILLENFATKQVSLS